MKSVFAALAAAAGLFCASGAFAGDQQRAENVGQRAAWLADQPGDTHVDTLCTLITQQTAMSTEPFQVAYLHRARILAWSGVTREEFEARDFQKVGPWWRANQRKLVCMDSTFSKGSVIAYAVRQQYDAFIIDVTRTWKLPPDVLNEIMPGRGYTVLDYVVLEQETAATPRIHQILEGYKRRLRAAGAKYRHEIDGVDCRPGNIFANQCGPPEEVRKWIQACRARQARGETGLNCRLTPAAATRPTGGETARP